MPHGDKTRVSLPQAINTWSKWGLSRQPEIIARLSAGHTNQSYLLENQLDAPCVLRLHSPIEKALGICRRQEQKIVEALYPLNISPQFLFWGEGYSVYRYVEGRQWTKRDWQNPRQTRRLLQIIEAYRRIPVDVTPYCYAQHVYSYFKGLSRDGLTKNEKHSLQRFLRKLVCIESHSKSRVLTHHDLCPENIVETEEGIVILDWEYAGMGWQSWDVLSCTAKPSEMTASTRAREVRVLMQWLEKLWWQQRARRAHNKGLPSRSQDGNKNKTNQKTKITT